MVQYNMAFSFKCCSRIKEPRAVRCCKRREGLCNVTPDMACESRPDGISKGEDLGLFEDGNIMRIGQYLALALHIAAVTKSIGTALLWFDEAI
jgi:hypothetical protein